MPALPARGRVTIATLLLGTLCCVNGKFLWMEEEPARDECTIIINGSKKKDVLDVHPPAHCRHGGYIHFANWARVHMWLYLDLETKQEFRLCLTNGWAESTYIWYDYCWKHWEPMVFPQWSHEVKPKDQCRDSINGTMDLYLEPPWWYVNYVSYFTWNITEIEDYQPKPWRRHQKWSVDESLKNVDVSSLIPESQQKRFKKDVGEAKKRKKRDKKDKKKKKKKKKAAAK